VHLVALLEQELSEVRSILSRNTCDPTRELQYPSSTPRELLSAFSPPRAHELKKWTYP
jgi:hypothetical protein